MYDKELDIILSETLGREAHRPDYLDTRLRGELAMARKTGRGISLWWLPLALSLGVGAVLVLLGALLPWPVNFVLAVASVVTVVTTTAFTVVGLACFGLRKKGRVLL